MVAEAVHADANIIFGAIIDDALGDEVRVTVIAAGFEGGLPKRREEAHGLRRSQAQQAADAGGDPGRRPGTRRAAQAERAACRPAGRSSRSEPPAAAPARAGHAARVRGQQAARRSSDRRPLRPAGSRPFDDDLDVPDFLK